MKPLFCWYRYVELNLSGTTVRFPNINFLFNNLEGINFGKLDLGSKIDILVELFCIITTSANLMSFLAVLSYHYVNLLSTFLIIYGAAECCS